MLLLYEDDSLTASGFVFYDYWAAIGFSSTMNLGTNTLAQKQIHAKNDCIFLRASYRNLLWVFDPLNSQAGLVS
jgi:hypothetical protein